MAFSFLDETELKKTFEDAKKMALPLHLPFDEWERIARNKPHPGIAKELPKVTDGTLAAIIQERPKRIVQQIPTGLVQSEDEWIEIVAGYILESEIIPNANQSASLLQKCWAAISKADTYGSQPGFVQFINRGEYFGSDFTLPYAKDVLLEPGKLSDRDSNYIFLRTYWSKGQIKQLLSKESSLSASAKKRGDTYEMGWDTGKLQELLEMGARQKDVTNQTPTEKNKMLNNGFFEIVHAFQQGVKANFYSFSPAMPDGENILRTKVNKDPRGVIPIHFMYSTVDLSNPLGRGSVELSGGMQNLIDSEVQSYQYMRSLLINPPLKVTGKVTGIKYAPGAQWKRNSINDDVEPVTLETKSLESFPNNYGLIKSQILQLNAGGSGDTSTSADTGNQSSKTPQGVKNAVAQLGVSDNYIRKQFEDWWGEMCETMLNIYFAERSGTQELIVDDETAQKLIKIRPGAVQNNTIRVDYDTETPKLKFKVDASSSNLKDNADQLDKASNILEIATKYPQLDKVNGGPIDLTELADRIVSMTGLEDPEKIVVKPDPSQPQEQPQVTPQMVQQMVQQAMEQEKANDPAEHPLVKIMDVLNIKFETLGQDVQNQLIQEIFQITPQGPTASAQDMQIKQQNADTQAQKAQSDAQLKAAELGHKMGTQQDQHTIASSGAAVQVAQLQHQQQVAQQQAQQAQATHQLATQQAGQQAQQAQQSHELATQTAQQQADQAAQAAKVGATSGK